MRSFDRHKLLRKLTFCLVGCGLLASLGCPSSQDPESTATEAETTSTDDSEIQCTQDLKGLYENLTPGSFLVTADAKNVVGQLNSWAHTCKEEELAAAKLDDDAVALLQTLLDEKELAEVQRTNFPIRDGYHVHAAILFHEIVSRIIVENDTELKRVVALFNFVGDNLLPMKASFPLPPTRALLSGRGSAAHRAWIFAELLRDLNIDSVRLVPTTSTDDEPLFLVGVLLDNETYLFDPLHGIPVPSLNEEASQAAITSPATLAEALENPKVLEQFADPRLTADAFKSPRVELIGTAALWAPRMRVLQQSLAGDQSAVVYDPLHDAGGTPGLYRRVVEAGGEFWNADNVAVWHFPEQQVAQRDENRKARQEDALSAEQQQAFNQWSALYSPLTAPIPLVALNEQTGEVRYGAPQSKLRDARIHQLRGSIKQALTGFVEARGWNSMPPVELLEEPPEGEGWIKDTGVSTTQFGARIRQLMSRETILLHQQASANATLWTADAQLAENNVDGAINSYQQLLRNMQWGFLFALNKQNKIDTLAIEDLQQTLTLQKNNWANFGQAPKQIRIYFPADVSPIFILRFSQMLLNNTPIDQFRYVVRPDSDSVVKAVALDAGGIGVVDLYRWSFSEERVKVLGVTTAPSAPPATVRESGPTEDYPFANQNPDASSVRLRLARALAQDGQFSEAISTLEPIPSRTTRGNTARILMERWAKLAAAPGDKAAE